MAHFRERLSLLPSQNIRGQPAKSEGAVNICINKFSHINQFLPHNILFHNEYIYPSEQRNDDDDNNKNKNEFIPHIFISKQCTLFLCQAFSLAVDLRAREWPGTVCNGVDNEMAIIKIVCGGDRPPNMNCELNYNAFGRIRIEWIARAIGKSTAHTHTHSEKERKMTQGKNVNFTISNKSNIRTIFPITDSVLWPGIGRCLWTIPILKLKWEKRIEREKSARLCDLCVGAHFDRPILPTFFSIFTVLFFFCSSLIPLCLFTIFSQLLWAERLSVQIAYFSNFTALFMTIPIEKFLTIEMGRRGEKKMPAQNREKKPTTEVWLKVGCGQ